MELQRLYVLSSLLLSFDGFTDIITLTVYLLYLPLNLTLIYTIFVVAFCPR